MSAISSTCETSQETYLALLQAEGRKDRPTQSSQIFPLMHLNGQKIAK
jgi:hypothetical protein